MAIVKLLDTNIILYYLEGKLADNLPKAEYYISVITEIELLSYPTLSKADETKIKSFIAELTVVDVKSSIKDLTIEIKNTYALKIPDAIIAATSIILDAELLSNDQHFSRVPKLKYKQLPLKK